MTSRQFDRWKLVFTKNWASWQKLLFRILLFYQKYPVSNITDKKDKSLQLLVENVSPY